MVFLLPAPARCLAVAAACVALPSCVLNSPFGVGEPAFTVAVLVEDATLLGPNTQIAAAWETSDGLHFVYAQRTDEFVDSGFGVYERAPDDAFDVNDGAARLVFFAAEPDVLEALNDDEAPAGPLATSRSSLWSVEREGAPVPFASSLLPESGTGDVLVVDSGDPVARRCGDDAAADAALCEGACDVNRGFVDAAEGSCCHDAQVAFGACDALVPLALGDFGEVDSDEPAPPVRLRVFP